MNTHLKRTALPAVALALSTLGAPGPAVAQNDTATTDIPPTRLLMPILNSARGRELFLSKGCVTCHSVNGVGGEDAAALDAHEMAPFMNLFDLTAKMWTMAPVMIPAQEDELGDQIQLNGDELANLVAFLHDDMEQANLTLDSLSHDQREKMEEMAGVHDGGGEADPGADKGQDQEAATSDSPHDAPNAAQDRSTRLLMPQMSGERGRKLFVSKGCVICHSINGVVVISARRWMPAARPRSSACSTCRPGCGRKRR